MSSRSQRPTSGVLRAVVLLAIVACSPSVYGQASSGYAEQSVITLGNSSQIPASQTNFTVLVCANMTLGNGNACATATGLKVTGSGGYVTAPAGTISCLARPPVRIPR